MKYLEIKYLDDVPFNSGGQQAIKNAVAQNGSASVLNNNGINLIDAVTDLPIPNTNSNLTFTLVQKLCVNATDLNLIVN